MIKKYIIVALVSSILLLGLFLINNRELTGHITYSFPDSKIVFELEKNSISNYFCKSEGIFYGTFNFNVIEGSYLPADKKSVGLYIYNKSADGSFNYSNSKFISLRKFMANTTPFIGNPIPHVLISYPTEDVVLCTKLGDMDGDGLITGSDATCIENYLRGLECPGVKCGDMDGDGLITGSDATCINNIMGGGAPICGNLYASSIDLYDSDSSNILSNIYKVDIGIYQLNLPLEGKYYYLVNISSQDSGGGEHSNVLNGEFEVVDRNCVLSLSNINLGVVGDGNLYNGKSVNCSANVNGRFFSDLSKSQDKINFSLEWYNGSMFFNYKSLSSGNSGIVCGTSSCSAIFSVSDSHLNKWRCSINVSDGTKEYIKWSNNITMINSPPTLIKNIPNQSFSGGFKEDFMQLSEYFSDKDGDVLSYSKLGGNKINLSINKDGSVNITAPLNYSLDEGFNILASDGINSTSNNLFFIKIINVSIGTNLTNVSCAPNWSIGDWGDCDPTDIRVRSVIDLNNCNISIGKPVGSESCIYTGTDVLTPPPVITQPGIIQKKESIFKNKFVLSGIILGLFLLLLIIILLVDKLRKGKLKFGGLKRKEKIKVEAAPSEVYKPKFEGVAPVRHVEEELSAVNFNEIVRYVKDMLGKGGKIEAVKEKLIASGWKKEQVEEAINFVRVKEFVEDMLSKGESKEKIIKLLKEKGWKEEFINKVLKE